MAGATELPAVDDVAVENELLAAHIAQEMVHFAHLAFGRAKVDIEMIHGATLRRFLSMVGWAGTDRCN